VFCAGPSVAGPSRATPSVEIQAPLQAPIQLPVSMPAVQVFTAEPATTIVQTTRPSTVTPAGAQLPTQGPLLPWPVHEPQRSAQAGSEPMPQLTPLTRPMQPTSPEPASPRTTGAETPRTRARRVTAREQHKAGISLSPEAEVTTDIPAEPSIPGPITEATGMQTRSRRNFLPYLRRHCQHALLQGQNLPKQGKQHGQQVRHRRLPHLPAYLLQDHPSFQAYP
jgi:hypothetical protein